MRYRKGIVACGLGILITGITLCFWVGSVSAQTENTWPMAGANQQRTSWTPEEVHGGGILWYRQIDPYIAPYIQIIAANSTLFISTAKGLIALNPSNGATKWIFPTDMPLGNSPTIYNGVAYVGGFDHKLYALDITNGNKLWSYDGAGAGYDTNPLVINNMVYLGNRDGYFYAIYSNDHAQKGQLAWRYQTDGPIPFSAAISTNNQTLYFASNDGHGYALNAVSGALVWKSNLLPGLGFRNWWPVVYQDKVVFVGTTPYRTVGPSVPGNWDLQNLDAEDFFYTSASPNGDIGPRNGLRMDVTNLADYLKSMPYRRTYFVLNAANGTEYIYGNGYYAPIAWYGTRAGSRYPPLVNGIDNIIYQTNTFWTDKGAIFGTRGGASGWIIGTNTITVPRCGTGLCNPGSMNASDEPMAISSGGKVIYQVLCCDRDADWFTVDSTGGGYLWSYNLDSLAPNYDQMYWGQAESGLNKLYGTFNGVYGGHGDNNPIVPYQGHLYLHRSNAVLAFGSGSSTGLVTPRVTVNTAPTNPGVNVNDLISRLDREVNKMINAGHLKPAYSISGNSDGGMPRNFGEAFMDNFHNTAELLAVLGRAYFHLPVATQTKLRTYLQSEYTNHSPIEYEHNGWNTGTSREPFQLPQDVLNAMGSFGPRDTGMVYNYYRDYGMWQYAKVFPSQAQTIFSALGGRPSSSASFPFPFQFNAAIAGTKGYLELARMAGNTSEANWAQTTLNNQLAARAAGFTKDVGNPGDTANDYTHVMSVASNFMLMIPELGDYLSQNAAR